jgi:hypothetical protein
MGDKMKVLLIALMGTLIGYRITDLFIVSLSFWQYFAIEVVVTLFHMLYEHVKQKEINR